MGRLVKCLVFSLVFVFCFCLGLAEGAGLKALIVTGQNNHGWQTSSPILKQILENTGLFEVETVRSPAKGESLDGFGPDFSAYNVVVLDYNGESWPESTKQAFVDYVRGGGGVVVYHAADNSFADWKEYNEIIGLGGWEGRNEKWGPYVRWREGKIVLDTSAGRGGGHGPQHEYQVIVRDASHPITKGLPVKWLHAKDELYEKLRGPAENLTVLATAYASPELKGSGEHEPVLFTVGYGQGRVFHTVLGHVGRGGTSVPAVECAGFVVTFARGAEWAASGEVTQEVPAGFPSATKAVRWANFKPSRNLSELLEIIKKYEYGQSRAALSEVSEMVRSASGSRNRQRQMESSFVSFLGSDATSAGKQFVCRQLSVIGTRVSVPVLSSMLTAKATSEISPADMARYALERIPGKEADDALRYALASTHGSVKVGIINSIGMRRNAGSFIQLSHLLGDSDEAIVEAAISALGNIGGVKAAGALQKARPNNMSSALYFAWADARMKCADRFLAEGKSKRAIPIYRRMYARGLPTVVRRAALRGLIMSRPERAVEIVKDVLKGEDVAMQAVVIGLLREISAPKLVKAVTDELPTLSVGVQVQVLGALADRGDRSAMLAAVDATGSSEVDVRVAGLEALGKLGGSSSVTQLVQTAAQRSGAEQAAARSSLYSLGGANIDKAILAAMDKADAKVKVELIRSVGERSMAGGVATLVKTAGDSSAEVRRESFAVLGRIAGHEDLGALIELLVASKSEADRGAAEKAVAAVARKSGDPEKQSAAVLAALVSVRDSGVRCSLLEVLGRIGNDDAYKVLNESLQDENNADIQAAAIRALSEWPGDRPIDVLLGFARSSGSQRNRVLALRGYVRLIGTNRGRSAEETIRMYEEGMRLAPNADEKKRVLSELSNAGSFAALEMAAAYLGDDALRAEAAAAAVKISAVTLGSYPLATKAVLVKVLSSSKNDSVRRAAEKSIEKIEQLEDYIVGWQVSGPYTKEGKGATDLFNIAFAPETNPGSVNWKIMPAGTDKSKLWLLDLSKAIGGGERVAYLRTNVSSPVKQKARLEMGSNDGIKAWLNGKVVHANNASRTITPDEDKKEVTLEKGWNTLLLKITQSGGTWSACARLRTVDGKKLEGLKVKAEGVSGSGASVELVGGNLSAWGGNTGEWKVVGEVFMDHGNEKRLASKAGKGAIVNGAGGRTVDILSSEEFGDIAAHIEFMVPKGSNSGVYFMGRYEIQVFDSWGVAKPKHSDCGGIYQRWDDKRDPHGFEGRGPRVNASLPPGQWQSFDIVFRAPRFDESGKKVANARFDKVVHNGKVVHENAVVTGPTRAAHFRDEKATGPLMLQGDHGPVAYRNIRIVPLK